MLEPMLEVRLFLVKEGNCMCEEEDDNFFLKQSQIHSYDLVDLKIY